MRLPKVKTVIAVPKPEHFEACTMTLKTIRTGFPNAEVEATIVEGATDVACFEEVRKMALAADCRVRWDEHTYHPKWVEQCVFMHARTEHIDCPLVVLDGDLIFWKSCEGWEFPTALAGYYIPEIYNDFARCRSLPRLHSSHLWFTRPAAMLNAIRERFPQCWDQYSAYCPLDLFSPSIKIIDGEPIMWDTGAVMYQLLGGTRFGAGHLDCYEHLHSASFFDVMYERLQNKKAFKWVHTKALKNLPQLRGELWKAQDAYYRSKAIQLLVSKPVGSLHSGNSNNL